jgi:hypothetical protein
MKTRFRFKRRQNEKHEFQNFGQFAQNRCSTECCDKRKLKNMITTDLGWALLQLKSGHKVRRKGWNGKGMWLALQIPDENSKMTLPYVYIEYPVGHPAYPQGSRVPWLASQTDLLSEDWELVD